MMRRRTNSPSLEDRASLDVEDSTVPLLDTENLVASSDVGYVPPDGESDDVNGKAKSSWQTSIRIWTRYYAWLYFMLLNCAVLFSSGAIFVKSILQLAARGAVIACFADLCKECKSGRRLDLLGYFYGVLLSVVVYKNARFLARGAHLVRPYTEFHNMLYDLQKTDQVFDQHHPIQSMQAMGLGNGYLTHLSKALQIHFDLYGKNETSKAPYIEHLTLRFNLFDDYGLEALVNVLQSHPHSYTTQLWLDHNEGITDRGIEYIAQWIAKPKEKTAKHLMWLAIGGTSVTSEGLSALYHAMRHQPFEYLGVDYIDAWLWPSFFEHALPSSCWRPIPASLPELKHAKYLRELSFPGNTLSDSDMPGLVEALHDNTNITKLSLVNNRIGKDGVKALIYLVSDQLLDLDLGMNGRIGDEGAILLAQALNNSVSQLEKLDLFSCGIGERGAQAFLSIFPQNTHLKYLSFAYSGGKISKDTEEKIQEAISANWN